MKRLVSTCHTGFDTGVNRHAGRGETCKHAGKRAAYKTGANREIFISADVNISVWRSSRRNLTQFERTHLINGVRVIKRCLRPALSHPRACARARRAVSHVHAGKFRMTQKISSLTRGLILCIMGLIVFAHCFARARKDTHHI